MKRIARFYGDNNTKLTLDLRKDSKGITLIALIVTIIVLLVLAGVTISNITGGDDTIDKAQDAKTQHEKSDLMERIHAAVLSSATLTGDFYLEDVKSAITKKC